MIEELKQRGLEPGGTSGFLQPFAYLAGYNYGDRMGANVIGILYPNRIKTDQKPTVLLSAHYDGALHYEESKENHFDCFVLDYKGDFNNNWSEICNSAVDNITGVAAILAIVDMVAEEISSPIAVAFWDGEEDTQTLNSIPGGVIIPNRGLLGSCYFATFPSIEGINESLNLHINFESIGKHVKNT